MNRIFANCHIAMELDSSLPFQTRVELRWKIVEHGGYLSLTVYEKTTHLVVNNAEKAKDSYQGRMAHKWGIPIVSLAFLDKCYEVGRLVEPDPFIVVPSAEEFSMGKIVESENVPRQTDGRRLESSLPVNAPQKQPPKGRKAVRDSVHTSCTISTMGFQTGAQGQPEERKSQRDAGIHMLTRWRMEGKEAEPKRYTSTNLQKQLLTYRPEGSKVSIEITEAELECLNPGEYLNDKVIDFFLMYLKYNCLEREQRNQFHIFSSFFHNKLTDSSQDNKDLPNIPERIHNRVKRWTRHVDLFDKDIVVLPICEKSHWYVAFICHPGQFNPETVALAAKNRAVARKRGRERDRVSAGQRKKPKTKTLEGAMVLSGDSCSQDKILLLKEEEEEALLPSQEEEEEERTAGKPQEVQVVSESDNGRACSVAPAPTSILSKQPPVVGLEISSNLTCEHFSSISSPSSPSSSSIYEPLPHVSSIPSTSLSASEDTAGHMDPDVPGAMLQCSSEGVGECGKEEEEEDTVCEVIETAPPSPIEPCIVVLDSLGVERNTIVRRLKGYLTEEWKAKKPDQPPKDFSTMRAVYPSVPLQNNSCDCGIFVLQYVENLLMSVVQGQPLLGSNKEWASYNQTRAKRAEIQDLILKLSDEERQKKS